MLQWINDRVKHLGWILLAPIALTFVVWGVHGIADFSTQASQGLKVNGQDLPTDRLRASYQEQIGQFRSILPDGEVSPAVIEATKKSLIDRYVGSALLDSQIDAQHYVVTDQQVVDAIHQVPAFQIGGVFNRDAYEGALRQQGYTPQRFEAEERKSLRSRELEGGLTLSAFVTPLEFKNTVALEKETRDAAYVLIPAARFRAAVHPDDKALSAYYEAHKASYQSEDTVSLEYVELKLEDLQARVVADDATLKAYFESIKDRYTDPEKRRARHILITAGADPAKAEAKATELYQAATAPNADFAALAKANSQDPGSAAQGGDLGWAERTSFVGPFADALFAMQPGEIKGPVKTQFGWHIIKLDDIQPGHQKSYDEVKPTIEAEYRKNEAEKRFGDHQEKLDTLAFENSTSLEPVAKALDLTVKSVPDYTRKSGGGGLPPIAKVVAAAFSADVLGGQNSRAIELKPGDVVVLRATNHRPPVQLTQAEAADRVRDGATDEAAAAAARAAADALIASLKAGKPLAEAIAPLAPTRAVEEPVPGKPQNVAPTDVRVQAMRSFERKNQNVPPALLAAIFTTEPPAAGGVSAGQVTLGNDTAVYAVSAIKPGVAVAKGPQDLRNYTRVQGSNEVAAYVATLRTKAKVAIDPKLFE